MLSNQSSGFDNTIPRKFHFIWVGGPIPLKYLRSIEQLAKIARQSGFEINLWTDKESNYYNTATKNDINLPDLRIRSINELLEKMQTDPFYQEDLFYLENNKLKKFISLVDRERTGEFKNLAAAADLLRYEILRQEGGCYLDTDIKFEINTPSFVKDNPSPHLTDETPEFGFKTNIIISSCSPWNVRNRSDGVLSFELNCNNDVIISSPNHEILQNVINKTIRNYEQFDKEVYLKDASKPVNYKLHPDRVTTDVKRFPNDERRVGLTIAASGPAVLSDELKKYWRKKEREIIEKEKAIPESRLGYEKGNNRMEALCSLSIRVGREPKVAGLPVSTPTDGTWYKQAKKAKASDTSSLPDKLFQSEKKPRPEAADIIDHKDKNKKPR